MQRQGRQLGTKAMIELLQLGGRHGHARLRKAIDSALQLGCTEAAAVRHLMAADRSNVSVAIVEGHDNEPRSAIAIEEYLWSRRYAGITVCNKKRLLKERMLKPQSAAAAVLCKYINMHISARAVTSWGKVKARSEGGSRRDHTLDK